MKFLTWKVCLATFGGALTLLILVRVGNAFPPPVDGTNALSWLDYWLERYQTLIASLAALASAAVLIITTRQNIAAGEAAEARARDAVEAAFVRSAYLEMFGVWKNTIELIAESTFTERQAQTIRGRYAELREKVTPPGWISEGLVKTSLPYGYAIKSFYEAAGSALDAASDAAQQDQARPCAFKAVVIAGAIAEAVSICEDRGALPARPVMTDGSYASILAGETLRDMMPTRDIYEFLSPVAAREVDDTMRRAIDSHER